MNKVKLQGSCLCGAVQYEATGKPTRFYHCHCSRCRKSSGTGHATNLFLEEAQLVFTNGEDAVQRYKIPEAERFTRQFCSKCGSSVARFVPELNGIVIPAGSLDNDPPIMPQARIFWDSRANWSCSDDHIPCFAELPRK
jgi:hypothetical protein